MPVLLSLTRTVTTNGHYCTCKFSCAVDIFIDQIMFMVRDEIPSFIKIISESCPGLALRRVQHCFIQSNLRLRSVSCQWCSPFTLHINLYCYIVVFVIRIKCNCLAKDDLNKAHIFWHFWSTYLFNFLGFPIGNMRYCLSIAGIEMASAYL